MMCCHARPPLAFRIFVTWACVKSPSTPTSRTGFVQFWHFLDPISGLTCRGFCANWANTLVSFSGRRTHCICRGGVNRQNWAKRPIIRRSGSPRTPRGFHARPRAVLDPRSPGAPGRHFPQHDLPPPAGAAAGQRPRIGSRRFIAAAAIRCPIARSTTNISPSVRWRLERELPTPSSSALHSVATRCRQASRPACTRRNFADSTHLQAHLPRRSGYSPW
jgi:hypothetical protein